MTTLEDVSLVLSTFTKSIMNRSDAHNLNTESVYVALDELYSKMQSETSGLIKEKNHKEVAKTFFLVSQALRDLAYLVNDKGIQEVLNNSAVSYSSVGDSALKDAAIYKDALALDAEKNRKFEDSSRYRSEAEGIEYSIDTGILRKELNRDISKFYPEVLKKLRSRIIKARLRSERALPPTSLRRFRSESKKHRINPEQISVKSNSSLLPGKDGWYKWSINLVANKDIMSRIKKVKYRLHPTFPEREPEVTDGIENGFKLESVAYGEFQIRVYIYFDDSSMITKYHWLDLGITGGWQGGRTG